MDRVKEVTGYGEPLYVDVCAAAFKEGKTYDIVGGRYGLGSKDVTPGSIISIYENLKADQPKNNFTIGIVDDVTGHSLPIIPEVALRFFSRIKDEWILALSFKFWVESPA